MKGKLLFALVSLAAPALVTAAAAQDDDLLKKIISVPAPKNYRVDGIKGAPQIRSDPNPQVVKALRVDVPGKGAHPWDIAVAVPVNKPVKAGDQLILAIWARLEKGENGATSTTLPYNAVQLAHDPYTAIFSGPLTIGPEWKLQQVEGRSNGNYAAGDLNVSIHLATAKQVVDIGPVILLDMGQ